MKTYTVYTLLQRLFSLHVKTCVATMYAKNVVLVAFKFMNEEEISWNIVFI
jgi:hypothetical protein